MRKYLIVGLGNIGLEYEGTRHNIGFEIVDKLASDINVTFKQDRYSYIARGSIKNVELVIIKPTTYMNLSGQAVRYWMQEEKIDTDRVLIVVDDLSISLGKIRIKTKGSDGGHNGLKNISQLIQTQSYPRLRFGIGNEFKKGEQIDFVLGKFSSDETSVLQDCISRSIDAIKCFCLEGVNIAMNKFNQ